jgi:hypothetical protein
MQKLTSSFSITNTLIGGAVVLAIIFIGNIIYVHAQTWTSAPSNPPSGNTPAPINVGGTYQIKSGDLGATRFRSNQYCNAAGTVCSSNIGGFTLGSPYAGSGWYPHTGTNNYQRYTCGQDSVLVGLDVSQVNSGGTDWTKKIRLVCSRTDGSSGSSSAPGGNQTFSWYTGSWSEPYCGIRTRSVWCASISAPQTPVGNINCSGQTKPSSEMGTYDIVNCGP